MLIHKAYKIELDPNNKQRTLLTECAGVARWTWNWGLGRRITEYENTGKSSGAIDQGRQITILKTTTHPWLYNYSKWIPQEALRNLDKAYQNFFRRVKNGEKPGFPKFKSKRYGVGSLCLLDPIRVESARIKLPRIGWLKLKEHDYIPNEGILFVTVSERAGKWFVSVQCRKEIEISEASGEPVGVDLGIKELAVCSDERCFKNPKALRRAQPKLKRAHCVLVRREKGSKNREKARQKLAKLYYRIACIRNDILHKVTSAIVAKTKPNSERPRTIVIEDLSVSKMLKNHRLAQAISDVGWAEFRRQLEYKTAWNGEELLVAARFFPSSKLCRHCGCINDNLTLADRKWICSCGAVLDRDLNAAHNLRNLAIRAGRPEFTPVERGRLRRSLKQEPSTESKILIGIGDQIKENGRIVTLRQTNRCIVRN